MTVAELQNALPILKNPIFKQEEIPPETIPARPNFGILKEGVQVNVTFHSLLLLDKRIREKEMSGSLFIRGECPSRCPQIQHHVLDIDLPMNNGYAFPFYIRAPSLQSFRYTFYLCERTNAETADNKKDAFVRLAAMRLNHTLFRSEEDDVLRCVCEFTRLPSAQNDEENEDEDSPAALASLRILVIMPFCHGLLSKDAKEKLPHTSLSSSSDHHSHNTSSSSLSPSPITLKSTSTSSSSSDYASSVLSRVSSGGLPHASAHGIDCGHRGSGANGRKPASSQRPMVQENTVHAFELLVKKTGTHWAETDVHLTRDDVLVVAHDTLVPLSSSFSVPVCCMSARQFVGLRRFTRCSALLPIRAAADVPALSPSFGPPNAFFEQVYAAHTRSSNAVRENQIEHTKAAIALEEKERQEQDADRHAALETRVEEMLERMILGIHSSEKDDLKAKEILSEYMTHGKWFRNRIARELLLRSSAETENGTQKSLPSVPQVSTINSTTTNTNNSTSSPSSHSAESVNPPNSASNTHTHNSTPRLQRSKSVGSFLFGTSHAAVSPSLPSSSWTLDGEKSVHIPSSVPRNTHALAFPLPFPLTRKGGLADPQKYLSESEHEEIPTSSLPIPIPPSQLKLHRTMAAKEKEMRRAHTTIARETYVEEDMPTFASLLTDTPADLGLVIEVKYTTDLHQTLDHYKLTPRNRFVDRILETICEYSSPSRPLAFTGFDPDVQMLLRVKQDLYPVIFNSCLRNISEMESDYNYSSDDARCICTDTQIAFARAADFAALCPFVDFLITLPAYASSCHANSLAVCCFGERDTDARVREYLHSTLGVSGIICDNVHVLERDYQQAKIAEQNDKNVGK